MDIVIRSYPDVSFYVGEQKKRWVYGKLCIYCQQVVFTEVSKDSTNTTNTIPFQNIAKIHKATTTIIYGAIVMTLHSGHTYWFSSFQNREAVFKLICHFQRNLLFHGEVHNSSSSQDTASQRTEMGTKLLHIANESMSNLAGAAVMLNQQGEQIDNSSLKMLDIHNDLDTADRITSGLENWLGRWTMPEEYKFVKPVIINDNEIPQIYDFEILFTKIETGKICLQEEGVVQVSKAGLNILNLKQKILHHFNWSNVSKIRVISPWEMMLIRYQIGIPDICFSFVSSLLVDVLHKIQCFAKDKLEYDTPNISPIDEYTSRNQDQYNSVDKKLSQRMRKPGFKSSNDDDDDDNHLDVTLGSKSTYEPKGTQDQLQKKREIITEAEVQELSGTLKHMKSLMLAVGNETDSQNEKLDKVTESVDTANIKLVHINKRINKLM